MTPRARAEALVDQLYEAKRDENVLMIEHAIAEAVSAEREACAKVADEIGTDMGLRSITNRVAKAIRARAEEPR